MNHDHARVEPSLNISATTVDTAAGNKLPKNGRANGARINLLRRPDGDRLAWPHKQGSPARPLKRLILPDGPYDPRTEKIRVLRSELMLRHEDSGKANMVALLSPQSGEGRSQLAAELAITFAQLGRPTLLVDADLRRPSQHVLFGTLDDEGLSQAIASGESPSLHRVEGFPELSLLTAGKPPKNPLELLSDRFFHSLVNAWRGSFDFVVIDTAPVAQFADGLAVAATVRNVVVLSRANHSTYRDTREMLRRLAATQSRIVGGVISHF